MDERPLVGIGVVIFKDGKILLGKRKSKMGDGEYASPGGKLEYMESYEMCARREVLEEYGLEIENIRFQFTANVTDYAPKHYVHIGLIADWKLGEPQNLEPEKCEGWDWYDLKALPQPMFKMSELAVDAYLKGYHYVDS